jgi:hypothetical protein
MKNIALYNRIYRHNQFLISLIIVNCITKNKLKKLTKWKEKIS